MTFFPTIEIEAGDRRHADALASLYAGEVRGVRVRGALDPATAGEIVARMEQGGARSDWPCVSLGSQFTAFSYGLGLDMAEGGLERYLASVASFEAANASVLSGLGWRERAAEIIGSLSTIAVETPRSPNGRPYLSMNLRRLPPGGRIPPHHEIEQLSRPQYTELAARLDARTVVSTLLILQPPTSGGELVVHDFGWHERSEDLMYRGRARLEPVLATRASVRFALEAGDLLVFDAGRFAHEIAPVGGERDRWTAGSFMARSSDGSRWFRWT